MKLFYYFGIIVNVFSVFIPAYMFLVFLSIPSFAMERDSATHNPGTRLISYSNIADFLQNSEAAHTEEQSLRAALRLYDWLQRQASAPASLTAISDALEQNRVQINTSSKITNSATTLLCRYK